MNNQLIVERLGTIMGIWAHPDDETFKMGLLLAEASAKGQKTICVTATRGEAGVQDESRWPREQLGDVRDQELRDALSVLGVDHHHYLGYTDGECYKVIESEAVEKLQNLVDLYKPDSIFTFPPDGGTGHEDHKSVCRWAQRIVQQNQKINLYYCVELKQPYEALFNELDKKLNIYFNLPQPTLVSEEECLLLKGSDICLDKKVASLEAMPSQTRRMFELISREDYRTAFGREGYLEAGQAMGLY